MQLLARFACVVTLGTVGQTACQHSPNETGDAESPSSTSVPESESGTTEAGAPFSAVAVPTSAWADFVGGFDHLRIVPEVARDTLVSIRCFYATLPQATEIGLEPADRIVAVNGTPVGGRPSTEAAGFLSTELERSRTSCGLSFTVEHRGTTRVLTAHCRD